MVRAVMRVARGRVDKGGASGVGAKHLIADRNTTGKVHPSNKPKAFDIGSFVLASSFAYAGCF